MRLHIAGGVDRGRSSPLACAGCVVDIGGGVVVRRRWRSSRRVSCQGRVPKPRRCLRPSNRFGQRRRSVLSKNRDRLLEGDIATRFLAAVLDQPRVKKLLSTEHFTVDGTLIEAWASLKSFKPRDGSDEFRQ